MKKSEAIEIVLDHVCGSWELDYDKVKEIINILTKKVGMLPPETKNPLVKQESILQWADEAALDDLYDRSPKVPRNYYVNMWEFETRRKCNEN